MELISEMWALCFRLRTWSGDYISVVNVKVGDKEQYYLFERIAALSFHCSSHSDLLLVPEFCRMDQSTPVRLHLLVTFRRVCVWEREGVCCFDRRLGQSAGGLSDSRLQGKHSSSSMPWLLLKHSFILGESGWSTRRQNAVILIPGHPDLCCR